MQKKQSYFCKIIVVLLLVSLSMSLFLTYNDILITKRSDAIYIKSSNPKDVIDSLEKSGFELNRVDIELLKLIDLPKEGWYKIEENPKGRFYFFYELLFNRAKTMGIVIFAGDTVDEIFTRLAKDMNLDKKEFLKYYTKYSQFLEGGILADKYIIAQNADEEVVVRYLLDISNKKLDFFARQKFGLLYTHNQLHKAIIMASIIHKESNNLKEMSTIASVINNRLKKGMRLQMDGTLCYGKYSHKIVTSKRIKKDNSYFNTYKHKGLPPYPICTVTMDALDAVTSPKETDYLYFMLNSDGTHRFTKNYDEHRKNIKKFKDEKIAKKEKKQKKEIKRDKPCKKSKDDEVKAKKVEVKVVKDKKKDMPKKDKDIVKKEDKIIVEKEEVKDINQTTTHKDINETILSVF